MLHYATLCYTILHYTTLYYTILYRAVGVARCVGCRPACGTANLRAKILDFRGFDSSRILVLRGGILMSIGNFPVILSQVILVGMILVGRLGVE